MGHERLDAWLAEEPVRAAHLVDDPVEAADRLDNAIAGCLADEAPEIPPWVAPSLAGTRGT